MTAVMDIRLTEEQTNIVEAVAAGDGNFVIEACPGSGKSTTLAAIVYGLGIESVIALTKLTKTAEDTRRRMPEYVHVTNVNKPGNRIVTDAYGWMKLEEKKYKYIAMDFVKELFPKLHEAGFLRKKDAERRKFWSIVFAAEQMADLIRQHQIRFTDTEKQTMVAEHFGIDPKPELLEIMPLVMERGVNEVRSRRRKDFTDQLFMPVYDNLMPEEQYEIVLLDEGQDLSQLDLQFAFMHLKPGGRMIMCGDPDQTIMAWSGLMIDAFHTAAVTLDGPRMRLSRTFRFGKNIAESVNNIRQIVTEDNGRPDGLVTNDTEPHLLTGQLRLGDVVIARWNRHLIAAAFECVAHGTPVKIAKQDKLGDKIIHFLKDVRDSEYYDNFPMMASALTRYANAEVEAMKKHKANKFEIAMFTDAADNAYAVLKHSKATSFDELIKEIERVFKSDSGVEFRSVHAAKGGEWDRVWILNPEDFTTDLPHPIEEQDWSSREELYVWYVANTRARLETHYVLGWGEYAGTNPKKG